MKWIPGEVDFGLPPTNTALLWVLLFRAMRLYRQIKRLAAGFVACLLLLRSLTPTGWSQEAWSPLWPEPLLEELLLEWQAQQVALEQLRSQQNETLRAIEQTRTEMAAVWSRGVDSTLARLDTLNETLSAQRAQDLEFMRASNRRILAMVVGLTGLLFACMLVVALLSTRAVNRLTVVLSSSALGRLPLETPPPAALLTESGAVQLQSALERLERRIAELENHSSHPTSHDAKAQAA